jgi:hypothetical protein
MNMPPVKGERPMRVRRPYSSYLLGRIYALGFIVLALATLIPHVADASLMG